MELAPQMAGPSRTGSAGRPRPQLLAANRMSAPAASRLATITPNGWPGCRSSSRGRPGSPAGENIPAVVDHQRPAPAGIAWTMVSSREYDSTASDSSPDMAVSARGLRQQQGVVDQGRRRGDADVIGAHGPVADRAGPALVATPAVPAALPGELGVAALGLQVGQADAGVDDHHRHPVAVKAGVGQGLDPELVGHGVPVVADRRVARADQAGRDHRVGEHPDHLGPGVGLGQHQALAVRVVGQGPPTR